HRRRFAAVLRTAPRLARFWPNAGGVATARFSPDGKRVVCGDEPHGVQVFDAETWEPQIPSIKTSPSTVFAWFTRDGKLLATVDTQGKLRHWDANTGKAAGPLLPTDVRSHRGRNYFDCVDYSADGRLMIAVLPVGVQIYEVPSGRPVGPLLAETSVVRHVRLSPDGRRALICGEQPALQIVEAPSGRPVWTPTELKEAVRFAEVSRGAARVATVAGPVNQDERQLSYEELDVWDVARRERVFPAIYPDSVNKDLQFSPDGNWIAVANYYFARMIDARTGRPARPSMNHNSNINAME